MTARKATHAPSYPNVGAVVEAYKEGTKLTRADAIREIRALRPDMLLVQIKGTLDNS